MKLEIENEKKTSLESFNPFNRATAINSPSSLKVCAQNSVSPWDLYYKPVAEIKSNISPQRIRRVV